VEEPEDCMKTENQFMPKMAQVLEGVCVDFDWDYTRRFVNNVFMMNKGD